MGLVIFLVIAAIVFAVAQHQRQETNRKWQAIAGELEFDFTPATAFSHPEMEGWVDGTRVIVKGIAKGSGKNKTTYTQYTVRHAPVGPPLTLTKQGSFSFLGRLVGRVDAVIGDPFFDERVVIDSDLPEQLPAFLTPTRRAAVLDLFASWPDGQFENSSITVSSRGLETNRHRFTSTVMRLVETAEVMADPEAVDAILERQYAGDMGAAAEQFHELNEQRPNAFSQILEAEVLVEMGRHDEAAEIFGDLDTRLPEDPSMHHWRQVSELPPPPPPPPERVERFEREMAAVQDAVMQDTVAQDSVVQDSVLPDPPYVPDPPGAATPSVPLDQQSVIDDLFAANRMSWQIVEHFELTYQNAAVEWRGEVTSFNSYLHDSDFGEGPGIKATVLLGRSGNSEFISNEVHAIVQFADGTELERGAEVGFAGTLLHVDRFSRKVYVHYAVTR